MMKEIIFSSSVNSTYGADLAWQRPTFQREKRKNKFVGKQICSHNGRSVLEFYYSISDSFMNMHQWNCESNILHCTCPSPGNDGYQADLAQDEEKNDWVKIKIR